MRKLIIDCDPGHDDAIAIMMALANEKEIKIEAITTVCGNNTVENMTRNAQIILDITRRKAILSQGATRPLVGQPVISDKYHGTTGMDGPLNIPEPTHPISTFHAVEAMRKVIQNNDKVSIAALAPLTNIALFIRTYPELIHKIEVISLMGGALVGGNSSEHAEFNIFVDPEAAEIVFSSGIPIVMSGLDVTTKAVLMPEAFQHLRGKGAVGEFFCELMDFYLKGAQDFGAVGCVMHDPCAVAWLIKPSLFKGERLGIGVKLWGEERGKTVVDSDRVKNTLVLQSVDATSLSAFIISSIENLASKTKEDMYEKD